MEPRKITPLRRSPINRLFFAINHYVSTGDHVGEGLGVPEGAYVRVLLPVNSAMAQDVSDFEAFRARFDELAPRFGLTLEGPERSGVYHIYSFRIHERDMDALARALRERPGPSGWGSMKAVIDKHNWNE